MAEVILSGLTQTLVTSVELLATAVNWMFAHLHRGFCNTERMFLSYVVVLGFKEGKRRHHLAS